MSPVFREPEAAPSIATGTVAFERQGTGNIAQPEDRIKRGAKPKGTPFLLDGDMLRVTNTGETPAVFRWGRKGWVVDVGESKFVIFEALVDALGDPRSVDDEIVRYNDGNGSKGVIMRRYDELSRLYARYGIEGEHLESWTHPRTGERLPGLLDMTPRLLIETADGQAVTFPALKPDMSSYPVPQVDEHKVAKAIDSLSIERIEADNEELRVQIERLEARLNSEVARREGVDDDG